MFGADLWNEVELSHILYWDVLPRINYWQSSRASKTQNLDLGQLCSRSRTAEMKCLIGESTGNIREVTITDRSNIRGGELELKLLFQSSKCLTTSSLLWKFWAAKRGKWLNSLRKSSRSRLQCFQWSISRVPGIFNSSHTDQRSCQTVVCRLVVLFHSIQVSWVTPNYGLWYHERRVNFVHVLSINPQTSSQGQVLPIRCATRLKTATEDMNITML